MRSSLLLLLFCSTALAGMVLGACAQTPPPPRPVQSFDPALVRERQRRLAAFDSVVRTVNTDSLYRLWQATLTAPDVRQALLLVQCELGRLSYQYGRYAAHEATKRMQDTLWKHADPAAVRRMDQRAAERGSIPITRGTCGPLPPVRAPHWLREWWPYQLPQLPPSPDDTATIDP